MGGQLGLPLAPWQRFGGTVACEKVLGGGRWPREAPKVVEELEQKLVGIGTGPARVHV